MSTVSILIPTIARPSLPFAMRSYLTQMRPGDELIVLTDGELYEAQEMFTEACRTPHQGTAIFELMPRKTGHYGAFQIDKGLEIATGDIVVFCGDDDCGEPGALDAIRERLAAQMEPQVNIFKYRETTFESGCNEPATGQQFVAPLELARKVTYAADLGNMNDRVYMLAVIAASGKPLVSQDAVICWVNGAEELEIAARANQNG